jgi:PPP family 3-phenylpropionic acid transporter
MDRSKDTLRVGSFYLLMYGAVGCLFPYLTLYYQRAGLTGRQIGVLAAITALVTQLASPLWGVVGDSRALRKWLLTAATGGAMVSAYLLSVRSSFGWLALVGMAHAFFFSPISPLVDSTALEVAAASQRSYGALRAWGTVGFILATLAVGRAVELFDLRVVFVGYALLMFGCLVLSLRFPARRHEWTGPLRRGLDLLLADRAFLIFLISAFLLTAAMRPANDFFALYLDAVGAREGMVGLTWAVAALVETPVLFFSGPVLGKLGARRLFLLACAVYAVRWFLYSQVTAPGIILVIQLLHGLSWAPYLVAGVVLTSEHAPEGLGATAQGVYSGTTMGLAAMAGSLAGGWLYDGVGVANMYRVCSLAAALALLLMLFSARARPASVRGGRGDEPGVE